MHSGATAAAVASYSCDWRNRHSLDERGENMRRILLLVLGAVLVAGVAWAAARVTYDRNYGQDRAEIDDLFSRYLFALDWQEPEQYGEVFAPDGVLVWAGGTVNGRAAIVRGNAQGARGR